MLECASVRCTLTLQAPTGCWGAGGHSVSVYRETGTVTITLPGVPGAGQQRYSAQELKIMDTSPYPAKPIAITSGYVEIDASGRRVEGVVSTPEGGFWANGSYPLRDPTPLH